MFIDIYYLFSITKIEFKILYYSYLNLKRIKSIFLSHYIGFYNLFVPKILITMKQKNLLCYFLVSFTFLTFAQNTSFDDALTVYPVSPEAASLGKYGEIPVNLATGKINYTIPLNAHELDVFLFFAMIDPKNKLYEN